jgi:hypothetical protein
LKDQDIHDGLWQLLVSFGFGAGNVGAGTPGAPGDVNPAAIVPILGIGLQQATELGPMVFDAAKLNPRKSVGARKPTKKKL